MSYQQTIYNICRQNGMTEAAALATVGNFQCESNCEPFRLEGDFSPYKTASKAYVKGVTNGTISRQQFAHDAKGFGLYQLTFWSRKAEYYDFWKVSGGPLDSAELQTKFAIKEMKRDFRGLWQYLTETNDIFTACSRICREFERPAVNNIDARFSAAKRYQSELDLNAWQSGATTETTQTTQTTQPTTQTTETSVYPAPALDDRLKLRVTDEHCAGWPEAYLVQAILIRRGYDLHVVDGVWDDEEIEEIKLFQRNHGLDADGIVGPKTWAELLKY